MVQEERVKDITESKQAKDGGIKIAGVLVTLDPSPLCSVLDYLVSSNSLVLLLPVRDCIQSCKPMLKQTAIEIDPNTYGWHHVERVEAVEGQV